MPNHSTADPMILATLLIVSRDSALAHGLALSLLDEPYEILVATSIGDAKAQLMAQAVDVVLVDEDVEDGFDGELFGYLRLRQAAVIRILLGREDVAGKARRVARNGCAHYCLPLSCEKGELALVLYNSLVRRSFLPPESEGILPARSSRPPGSSLQPSRSPSVG